jgi:hypothetical protein
MYNFQSCGETAKATPEPDDIAAVCAIYPLADDPGTCERVNVGDSGCCAVHGSNTNLPLGAVMLALVVAFGVGAQRRRRRS